MLCCSFLQMTNDLKDILAKSTLVLKERTIACWGLETLKFQVSRYQELLFLGSKAYHTAYCLPHISFGQSYVSAVCHVTWCLYLMLRRGTSSFPSLFVFSNINNAEQRNLSHLIPFHLIRIHQVSWEIFIFKSF